MSTQSTEQLLSELARDLTPVRPIARLRSVLLGAAAIWLLASLVHWALGAPRPRTGAWGDPAFVAILVGLALTGAGALLTAVAAAVPGRDAAVRKGRGATLAGALLAFGAGAWAVALAEPQGTPASGFGPGLSCALRASALGVLPALLLCAFLARGVAQRLSLAVVFAAVGGLALGAVTVHTSCPYGGALHALLAHALTPFVAALWLALPLVGLTRSWAGRRSGPD
ncbi:MAG: NrsF family protein [Myxococcota bacterium]